MAGLISTTTGIISGIDYGTIIDKLMELAKKPVDQLSSRTTTLENERVAVTTLSAYLLAVRYGSDSLAKADAYTKRQVTSSDASALAASVTGTPTIGTYQYTPLQTAQQQQFTSSGLASNTSALGGGSMTFRFGDDVERSFSLDLLHGGQGFQRGKIRITDGSGATAEIDLTSAQSIDDVLDAINSASGISVTASTQGGSIRLTDNSGQSISNLKVQEVGRGKTAASLGLAGINTSEAVVDGDDLLGLTSDTLLSGLNDGKGVNVLTVLPDISYTLRDGTTGSIDFSMLDSTGEKPQQETTIGDILDVINSAQPGRLKAEISADGKRLVVTDLTSGESSFSLSSPYGSKALADLGLDGSAIDGVITGRQITGGLKTVLLSSLNGGRGLGKLGQLQLTNRNGVSTNVDLAAAETLEDVVNAINAANAGITAAVNGAKNGISLTDTTGGSAGPMIVADVDASGTAAALKIAGTADKGFINSGDLHLQVISESTTLSGMNGGAGVALGTFTITTSAGNKTQIDLSKSKAQTIGEVIRQINQQSGNVLARINDTGDGILLIDLEHGSGTFSVTEGNSSTAAGLHLLKTATKGDYGGASANMIDGSITQTITLGNSNSLADLASAINNANAGVTATTYSDGSSRPYHLSLTSKQSGRSGRLVIDTSGISGLDLTETVQGRDALMTVGATGSSAATLIASSTNQFKEVLPGVTLAIKRASSTPVTVTVGQSDTDVVAAVQTLVNNYNKFRNELNADTDYNVATNTGGVLFGDGAALRLETELASLLTRRFSGLGSVQTLAELGIDTGTDGTLTLDTDALQAKFAEDPEGVRKFFATADTGFAAKLATLIEQMCGEDVSLLAHRYTALTDTINRNQAKIDELTARLDKQRDLLTVQFAQCEAAIAKMQSNLTILDSIQSMISNTANKSSSSK